MVGERRRVDAVVRAVLTRLPAARGTHLRMPCTPLDALASARPRQLKCRRRAQPHKGTNTERLRARGARPCALARLEARYRQGELERSCHLFDSSTRLCERQKRTMRAIGLRKMNQSVEVANTPEMKGMIASVAHLLKVEEV